MIQQGERPQQPRETLTVHAHARAESPFLLIYHTGALRSASQSPRSVSEPEEGSNRRSRSKERTSKAAQAQPERTSQS